MKISIFLLSVVLFSCKKDKDENPPNVIITGPAENSAYNVLDPVIIQANISDDVGIERIQISLISATTLN